MAAPSAAASRTAFRTLQLLGTRSSCCRCQNLRLGRSLAATVDQQQTQSSSAAAALNSHRSEVKAGGCQRAHNAHTALYCTHHSPLHTSKRLLHKNMKQPCCCCCPPTHTLQCQCCLSVTHEPGSRGPPPTPPWSGRAAAAWTASAQRGRAPRGCRRPWAQSQTAPGCRRAA